MNIFKKVLFVLFTFIISFSFFGCSYKPSSQYAKEEIQGNVFVKVTIDLEDPQNSVLIKDSINKLLIQKLDADIVNTESLADTIITPVCGDLDLSLRSISKPLPPGSIKSSNMQSYSYTPTFIDASLKLKACSQR